MKRSTACTACGQWRPVALVLHRQHTATGYRTRTRRRPLCCQCAIDLTARYDLEATMEAMGPGYFVEGWHADGVLAAREDEA